MIEEFSTGWLQKTYQQPRPEIVGTVVAPFSKGVIAMGERDFHPMSANFLLPKWVKTHWPNYVEGKGRAGVAPDVADWRIARTIFVADDAQVARSYGGESADSPYRLYYRQLFEKLKRSNRHEVFKETREEPEDKVTLDTVLQRVNIVGTVDSVVDQILAFRETVGPFGELVYGNVDWLDKPLARRSLQLMAEEVMPRVNAALRERQ